MQSYVFGESVGSILGVTTLVGIESIILSKTEGNNFFSISFLSDYFDFEKLIFRSLFIIFIFGMKSRVIRLWLKIVGVVVPLWKSILSVNVWSISYSKFYYSTISHPFFGVITFGLVSRLKSLMPHPLPNSLLSATDTDLVLFFTVVDAFFCLSCFSFNKFFTYWFTRPAR